MCGPIDPMIWNGMKYFIIFLDDFTHFIAVFLIKGKFEITETIKLYPVKWKNKVMKLRCDNSKEYTNKELQEWYRDNGMILDYTISYSL